MDVKFWKRVFAGTCILFTAALIAVSCIMLLINNGGNIMKPAFSSFRTLMLIFFSFVLMVSVQVYKQFQTNEGLRVLINYVLAIGSFMLFVFWPMVAENQAYNPNYPIPSPIITVALISVPYFVIYGVSRLISSGRKKEEAKKEYKPVYKKSK
jgi:hypothetical protein